MPRWSHRAYFRSRSIGEGSYGQVCIAYAGDDGTEVAAKVFDPDDDDGVMKETFRELAVLSAIETSGGHPNIVALLDVGFSFDALDVVVQAMPLLECSLLSQIGTGSLRPQRRLRCVWELGSALEFLHANDVVHRDVKPDNFVLCDGLERGVLVDFSFARRIPGPVAPQPQRGKRGSAETPPSPRWTHGLGTPTYTAPELLEDAQPPQKARLCAADMWSAGVFALETIQDKELDFVKDRAALRFVEELKAKLGEKPVARMLRALLEVDPERRLSAEQLLSHEAFGARDHVAPNRIPWVSSRPKSLQEVETMCKSLGLYDEALWWQAAYCRDAFPEAPLLFACALAQKLCGDPDAGPEVKELLAKGPRELTEEAYRHYEFQLLARSGGNVLFDHQVSAS